MCSNCVGGMDIVYLVLGLRIPSMFSVCMACVPAFARVILRNAFINCKLVM